MRRRLDTELVRRGLVESRTRAAEAIRAGRVTVAGAPATSPARQVAASEPVHLSAGGPRFVSRGGSKLDAALDGFGVVVAGRRCIDVGASTGGFTDCLLQRGAAHVVAVDVGRGQLAWSLRTDRRVTVRERTNIRAVDPAALGAPFAVCVADLSFVSLRTVAPALAALTDDASDLVLLVKPQFEAGRGRVGKGGIVRDPQVHREVLHSVGAGLAAAGLGVQGLLASPLRGADGNVEFLAHVRHADASVTGESIDEVVAAADGAGGAA